MDASKRCLFIFVQHEQFVTRYVQNGKTWVGKCARIAPDAFKVNSEDIHWFSDKYTSSAFPSAFVEAYQQDTADAKFNEHWYGLGPTSLATNNASLRSTWFTQSDVDKLFNAGINTVRIPV